MPDFTNALEDYLAALPEDDWQALTARVRPPSAEEELSATVDSPAQQFAAILTQRLHGEPK